MAFLPPKFEVFKGDSGYTKLQKGANKLRILSEAITGAEAWIETPDGRRPVRAKDVLDEKMAGLTTRQFIACVIWNYETENFEIWSVTQFTIMDSLVEYEANPDWGEPFGYDITITRRGEDKKTKYALVASPKKEMDKAIQDEWNKIKGKVDMDKFYSGGHPLKFEDDNQATTAEDNLVDAVTAK